MMTTIKPTQAQIDLVIKIGECRVENIIRYGAGLNPIHDIPQMLADHVAEVTKAQAERIKVLKDDLSQARSLAEDAIKQKNVEMDKLEVARERIKVLEESLEKTFVVGMGVAFSNMMETHNEPLMCANSIGGLTRKDFIDAELDEYDLEALEPVFECMERNANG